MSEPSDPGSNGHVLEAELARDLGLVSVLAIGVGTMIAAGIFTLSGLAVGYVGSAAIASFLLAALVATLTALTYCEFSSLYPQSGEGYLYARRTFPVLIAYMDGWCLLLGYTASSGFYIASFSSYFNEFIVPVRIEVIPGLVAVTVLTLLNIKGTKESGTLQVVITAGKVALLFWFVGGGLLHVDPSVIVERFSTDLPMIGSTAAMVFITIVVQNRSVTDGIVAELKNHDGVIVGAAGKSFFDRILFGNIPEEVARLSDKPVIVVKRHDTVKALFGRVMSE